MIKRRNKERDESTIDITPMLDIVFIMLIFFIVTTSFVKETGVEVNRPNASTAVRDERGKLIRWFGISRERKNKQKDFRVEDDIKELASAILSDDALVFLNNWYTVVPLASQAQQCQGFLPSLFSVKLTSNLGLWWWQKGQWYA